MSTRKLSRGPSTSRKRARRVDPLRNAEPPRAGGAEPSPKGKVPLGTALLFGPAIFTGALLLFAVQPLIARYLLPWFGGGPGVWTTCMLFFQAVLLGGYLYAHLSVRHLPTRAQLVLHLALLAGALALLPIVPAPGWKPTGAQDPAWRILLLLSATIGLPYFVLSATSPLLQAWFVRARPGVSPYRLFALSNLGSLLALLGYPMVLEPLFTRGQQAWIWSGGLILFAPTCLGCAIYCWRRVRIGPAADAETLARDDDGDDDDGATGATGASAGRMVLWLALPMIASVLLLAITNTLTEDVAATPLLWVLPLAIYLLTFVIAFDSPRWYSSRAMVILLPVATLWVLRLQWLKTDVTLLEQFVGYQAALFVLCLFCHGELARLKPPPLDLTRYYLLIAVGGALGGVFVAIVAPRIFDRLMELPIGVAATAALALASHRHEPRPGHKRWLALFAGGAALLLAAPVLKPLLEREELRVIERTRNFYGSLVIGEVDTGGRGEPADLLRGMKHGSTTHGVQYLSPARRGEPTMYFRRGSGVSFAFDHLRPGGGRRVGIVGLGVGTLAAYGKPGDTFRFYEINPDVERLAREHFTFLADSPAKTDVILGDARLTLEREEPQQFDVLVLDAFSGDAIPAHLLTAEAFDAYRRHLKPDGVIALHISNRTVDLVQVVLRQVERAGLGYAMVADVEPNGRVVSTWMLMTDNQSFLANPEVRKVTRQVNPDPSVTLWTDDHINLLQVIRWVPGASGRRS